MHLPQKYHVKVPNYAYPIQLSHGRVRNLTASLPSPIALVYYLERQHWPSGSELRGTHSEVEHQMDMGSSNSFALTEDMRWKRKCLCGSARQ